MEKMKIRLNNYDHVKGFNVSVVDTIELEGALHVVYFHTKGKYAEEMNGKLTVSCCREKGSLFRVILPEADTGNL